MLTRRSLLGSAPLLALTPGVPAALARAARAAGPMAGARVLVVVQLDGGNDALNTLVPFADPEYARLRPVLKLSPHLLVRVSDSLGLHPSLRPLAALWEAGHLALVPGVGSPNPSRSHFESMAVWHTARAGEEARATHGWIGRALDDAGGESCVVGAETPAAVRGRRAAVVSLARAEDLVLADPAAARAAAGAAPSGDDVLSYVRREAAAAAARAEQVAAMARDRSDAAYPDTALGRRLRLAARMLKAGSAARVVYTTQGGYDTHAQQADTHARLLDEFAGAVAAFFADLGAARMADRVALLAFSEFGRTIRENGSAGSPGTDHGTAGCLFLAGPGVRGGVHGTQPSLTDLVLGEPRITTDFRRVYAAVLSDWLSVPLRTLGGSFTPLPVFGR